MHVDRGWLQEVITIGSVRLKGVPEVPTAAGDSRISSITKESRCKELCGLREQTTLRDKSVWSSSGEAARGAKDLQQGPRDGVQSRAATGRGAGRAPVRGPAQAREEQRDSTTTGSTRHADRSISLGMSASRSAHWTTRHVATRTLRGTAARGMSADHTRESFGGIATPEGPKR